VEKLEVKRRRMDPGASSARHKRPIEFTNGHLQLQCLRGRWPVQNWRGEETAQYSWIAPEENLLSALIRPPCNGGRMHCICIENEPTALATRSDRLNESVKNDANDAIDTLQISQDPTSTRREWPHEITETIILYLRKMNWRTPFLWRLRSTNTQWKIAIESVGWKEIDLSSCSIRDGTRYRIYTSLDSPGSRDRTLRGPVAQ